MRAPKTAARQPPISIRVDPRVELLSLLFRLAGSPEYSQHLFPRYVRQLESHFGRFRDHAAVRYAARLREERAISFDAVMSLAVHVTDPPELRERCMLAGSSLDDRWRGAQPGAFLKAAQSFVEDTGFVRFLEAQRRLREQAEARLRRVIRKHLNWRWFRKFFGARPGARFRIAIGLSNGGMNFGLGFRSPDGTEELYAIIGVSKTTQAGLPIFDVETSDLLVHEFGHSFVNPIVSNHLRALRASGRTIFPLIEESMRRQAYTTWPIVAIESILHAVVARYIQAQRNAEEAAEEIIRQQARGFLWDDDLFALLGVYEYGRDRYPLWQAFFPNILAYFNDLAHRIDAKGAQEAALKSSRPRRQTPNRRGRTSHRRRRRAV